MGLGTMAWQNGTAPVVYTGCHTAIPAMPLYRGSCHDRTKSSINKGIN